MEIYKCNQHVIIQRLSSITAHKANVRTRSSKPEPSYTSAWVKRQPAQFLIEPWNFRSSCDQHECKPAEFESEKSTTANVVLFIKSRSNSFYRRQILRQSWASVSRVGNVNVSVVFVVGSLGVNHTRNKVWLLQENATYGDVLQYKGSDDYRNIALKTLAGMEWASLHLPSTFLYSSMDDDFMVDIFKLHSAVNQAFELKIENKWPEFPIICMFIMATDERPYRDENGIFKKWFISESLFKWPVFPRYCHGGMYTTSMRIIDQLLRESWSVDSLYLDDVWITGILRQKIGMPDQMVMTLGEGIGMHKNKVINDTANFMMEWKTIKSSDSTLLCTCNM
uniref:Hexosyltransferase n=2 Tax=Ciona intestinalis TaxID=7719 RepID=H2XTZ0_CIOIN